MNKMSNQLSIKPPLAIGKIVPQSAYLGVSITPKNKPNHESDNLLETRSSNSQTPTLFPQHKHNHSFNGRSATTKNLKKN